MITHSNLFPPQFHCNRPLDLSNWGASEFQIFTGSSSTVSAGRSDAKSTAVAYATPIQENYGRESTPPQTRSRRATVSASAPEEEYRIPTESSIGEYPISLEDLFKLVSLLTL